MGKTYYLDLNTLLTYLQNKSGTLTTSFQVSRRACIGSISVVDGQITTCTIEWSDGKRIEGNEAFEQLRSRSEWQVHFTNILNPLSPSIVQNQPPASRSVDTSYIPQPGNPVSPTQLTNYTTQQRIIIRMVNALVDGKRTIVQIKMQLNLPPETVDIALDILQKIGAIY